jgi:hypothetical protein
MAISTLMLFNEKVERLDRLSFTQYVRQNKIGFSVNSREGEPVTFDVRGPGEEATDAFVLTLRLFIQDNESISIRRMGSLYDTLPVPDEMRERFRISRERLNMFLGSSASIQLHSEVLTHRKILEVFLYGGLAHANAAKRAEFEQWARNPMLFGMLQFTFHSILITLMQFLLWARHHNLGAIAHLQSGASPA